MVKNTALYQTNTKTTQRNMRESGADPDPVKHGTTGQRQKARIETCSDIEGQQDNNSRLVGISVWLSIRQHFLSHGYFQSLDSTRRGCRKKKRDKGRLLFSTQWDQGIGSETMISAQKPHICKSCAADENKEGNEKKNANKRKKEGDLETAATTVFQPPLVVIS